MKHRRAALGLALALTVAIVAAACSSVQSPSPTASRTPPSSAAHSDPTQSPASSATPDPTPGGLVPVDRTLLDVLPDTVEGLTVEASPEAEADAASDPGLAAIARSYAAAVAVDPQSGDFVYAAVVSLRAGVVTDQVFREWRDSFDVGACSQAGGIAGNAQAELGGQTVFIGTCAGGLHTYHVWIADRDLLVSAASVGEARLGEQLMSGLR